MFNPEFLATDNNEGHDANALIQYLQDQPADVLQRVAKSASPEIQEIIKHNVQGLLGMLPGDQFEVKALKNEINKKYWASKEGDFGFLSWLDQKLLKIGVVPRDPLEKFSD